MNDLTNEVKIEFGPLGLNSEQHVRVKVDKTEFRTSDLLFALARAFTTLAKSRGVPVDNLLSLVDVVYDEDPSFFDGFSLN